MLPTCLCSFSVCPPHEMAHLAGLFLVWEPDKPKGGPSTEKEASFLMIYSINCQVIFVYFTDFISLSCSIFCLILNNCSLFTQVRVLVTQSDSVTVALQAPLSVGSCRQEYWGGQPIPSPGDLPQPEIKPESPALAGRLFTTEPPGKPGLYQQSSPHPSGTDQKGLSDMAAEAKATYPLPSPVLFPVRAHFSLNLQLNFLMQTISKWGSHKMCQFKYLKVSRRTLPSPQTSTFQKL